MQQIEYQVPGEPCTLHILNLVFAGHRNTARRLDAVAENEIDGADGFLYTGLPVRPRTRTGNRRKEHVLPKLRVRKGI